jgi:hypothetical protein
MKDKLRSFIEANRDAFDSEKPGDRVFDRIRLNLVPRGRSRLARMFSHRWAAIAAGFLLIATTLLVLLRSDSGNVDIPTGKSTLIEDTDPVYAIQISQFQQLIDLQQGELGKLKKEQPQLYEQFSGDLAILDSAFRELKDQMETNPNREMLLEAMISNLQLQSELLSRQLTIIRQIKQQSNSYEKTRI